MAQMPIQLVPSRVQPFAAASPATFPARPKVEIPRNAYLYDTSGISGGLLRPGAVDQQLFKAYLEAARKDAVLAPPTLAKAPMSSGIPNLSPAQLAALGAVEQPAAGELVIDIPAANPADPGPSGAGQSRQALPGQPGGIEGATGKPATPLFPAPSALPPAAGTAAPDASAPAATEADPGSMPAPEAPAAAPTANLGVQASAERGPTPGAHRGADGVWELPRRPDKDEQEMLVGQKWRVVENEESRKLFLGPDGEFGWDDFVDVINPLQHIPLVNIAYRAITGDEIYGAARMVDFAFGPLAGVSTAVDLMFRDMTGKSMASNAVSALFGPDDEAPGEVSVNTASAVGDQATGPQLIRRGSNK
jgi:hypothetical protein